jgi:putative membrane protein
MVSNPEKVLVLCVDRDDDVGVKTGIKGPIVGRDRNVEAASRLAMADPSEADANAIFGAVKVYDEMLKELSEDSLLIATVTGSNKSEFLADREIIRQMSEITKDFRPDMIILVSDGADDERVIPLLSRFSNTISIRRVLVQQSREMEDMYFLLKRYLEKLFENPKNRAIAFGIPGVILFLGALFYVLNIQRYFYAGAGLLIGLILLDKAFDISRRVQSAIGYFGGSLGLISFIGGLSGLTISIILMYNEAIYLIRNYPFEILLPKLLQDFSLHIAISLSIMFWGSFLEKFQKKSKDAFERLFGAIAMMTIWPILQYTSLYLLGTISLQSFIFFEISIILFLIALFFLTLHLGWRKFGGLAQ